MLFAVWNHKETAGAEGNRNVATSAISRFLRFQCDFLISQGVGGDVPEPQLAVPAGGMGA